jgi:hypothetical protein
LGLPDCTVIGSEGLGLGLRLGIGLELGLGIGILSVLICNGMVMVDSPREDKGRHDTDMGMIDIGIDNIR